MSKYTLEQKQALLNDPYITQGTKDMLRWGGDAAYEKAIAERDARAAADKTQRDAVAKADKDLDAMARPAAGGSTTKSDQVLDLGNPALDFFSQWADQVWNKMPEKPFDISYKTDVWDKFHENREINFQKMFDEVEDLTKARKAVSQTQTDATSALNTLFHDWKGEGATAAKVKYEQRIQPDAQELLAQMDGAIKLVPATVDKIYTALKLKVDETLKLRVDRVATAPLHIAKQVIEVAHGKVDSKEKILDIAVWLDSQVPGNNLAGRLRSDDCDLNDENREYAKGAAQQWLTGSFRPEFESRFNTFKKLCTNATETINTQYHELSRFMEDYTNPFPAPGSGTQKPPGNDGNGSGKPPGNGGGTPPGSGGGTPPGSGGGTPPSASVPEAPKPEDKPAEGMNPITGKPLEVDPETGKPYPIDPTTGDAIKDGMDGQDTMTVQKGDNTIEMSEPDKDGKMDIKVDDGKGNEKDYKLDFDDPKAEGEGKPGEEGKDPKDAGFGPQGAVKEGQPGADGVYRPGPDGKIHIQDGNLKITAEQPQGPNGPTVVTVDDGKGEPTTYTLDEKGEKTELKPGDVLKPGEELKDGNGLDDRDPGNPQPGKIEDVRPMPAMVDGSMPGEGGFSAPGGVDVGPSGGEGTAAVSAGAEGAAVGGAAGGPPSDGTVPTASGGGGGSFEGALGGVGGDGAGALNEAGSLEAGVQSGGGAQPSGADSGLGMAPGGMDAAPAGAGAGAGSSSGMGGMGGGMMGGMGAMGAAGGGGGGGDTQRGSSQYRVEGGIFETSGAGGRISGSLDDEGDRSISYER